MKAVNCRSVGQDCDFEARGETVDKVMEQCIEHARDEHDMDVSPELERKVRGAIRDVPAWTSGGGA